MMGLFPLKRWVPIIFPWYVSMKFSVHPYFCQGFFQWTKPPKVISHWFCFHWKSGEIRILPAKNRKNWATKRARGLLLFLFQQIVPAVLAVYFGAQDGPMFFFPGGWLMNREVSNKWYAKPTPLIGSNSKVVLFIIFTRGKITLFLVRRGDYTTWFLGIAITMNWEFRSKSTSISSDKIRLCLKRTRINWYDTDVYWPQPSGMRFLLVGFQHRRSSWRADDGGFRSARSTTCSARHDLSWRCKGHNFQEHFNEIPSGKHTKSYIENCDLVRGFTHW